MTIPIPETNETRIKELEISNSKLQQELHRIHRKIGIRNNERKALQRQVQDLRLKVSEGDQELRRQITDLKTTVKSHDDARLEAYQSGIIEGVRTQSTPNERVILIQQVDAYKAEAAKWKAEAFYQGSKVVSECWQASVDEGVRREREKDSAVIKALRNEIAGLKAARKRE